MCLGKSVRRKAIAITQRWLTVRRLSMSWIRTLVSSAPDREATMVSAVQRLEEVGSAWTVGEEEEEESTGAITSYAAFLQHPENADSRLAACKVAQHKVLEHTRKDATAARKSWKDASELAFQRGGSLFHKIFQGPQGERPVRFG